MNSYQSSTKLLFERILKGVVLLCIFLIAYYFVIGNIELSGINLIFLAVSGSSLLLSKSGRENIAVHLSLNLYILSYALLYIVFDPRLYSVVMIGCSLMIFVLTFFDSKSVHRFYLFVIVLLQGIMMHCAMDETGFSFSPEFWPEYFISLFHVLIVFLLGKFFFNRLRKANLKLDEKEKDLSQKDEDLKVQHSELLKYIESNKELENFAYLASHELKAPLRNIKGFVDLVSKSRAKLNDEQMGEYLEVVSDNSSKMSDLIDALHELGSVEQTEIKKTEIPIKTLIDQVIAERSPDAPDAIIECNIDTENVFGDRTMLHRLFSNLIGNAIKFIPSNKLPHIQIECYQKSAFFYFRISDNGIGIPKEKRKEVFELFNRQVGSDIEGMGIGLSLSKKIVDLHHGTIGIFDSKLGGACFEIRIPAIHQDELIPGNTGEQIKSNS